jgi:polyhydroxyalkanoate synthesis regulator phasin
MDELNYKEEIEALQEDTDFEVKGDAKYLEHEDDEARLQWAFYRPSGSHPKQVGDKNVLVAIMAFNHSRLKSYERFTLLNPQVINDDRLRIKIRNRSRMLFRAMIDDDFTELVAVLEKYPVFLDLAYDQMINGRIWNETYADVQAASKFLNIANDIVDERLKKGIQRRLHPIKKMNVDEAKNYMQHLLAQADDLHTIIKEHFAGEFDKWIQKESLHPLQKILWEKQIDQLRKIQ